MTGWRKWAGMAAALFGALLVVLSFLPLWQTDRWWVRMWDYPRLQIAALLMLLGALIWAFHPKRSRSFWLLAAGIGAALIWQFSHFLAYLPPYPKQVASIKSCPASRQIGLMNANVLLANREYGKLLRLVEERRPDVILLLEADGHWAKAVAPLASRYPYRLSEAVPNTYGMILLSRLPMRGRILNRLQPGVPSVEAMITLPGGSVINFDGLHPEPPLPGDDSGERDAELVSVGRQVRDRGRAAIVMGDLNDVAWSRTSRLFKQVAGMNDPRVGRGFYPTFDASKPLLRWPLDHLFVSPHWQLMQIDRLPKIGSDHFPIYFRLCLTDRPGERKVSPSAPASVEQEANEEVRAGQEERREENAQ